MITFIAIMIFLLHVFLIIVCMVGWVIIQIIIGVVGAIISIAENRDKNAR